MASNRNSKLGGNDWEAEHPTYQDMNETNDAIIDQEIGNAEIAVRILQANNVYTNGPNVVVDEFTDEDGTNNTVGRAGAEYDSGNDHYKIFTPTVYVIITATSITGSWSINNCELKQFASNKWVLYCTTGTDEVKRAQIMKTLFYGTNGTDARITTTYVTGISALETTESVDVGRQAYYSTATLNTTITENVVYTGTFANTTDNTVDTWGFCNDSTTASDFRSRLRCPIGTTLIDTNGTPTSIDEIGTDTTADRKTNPNELVIDVDRFGSTGSAKSGTARVVTLTKGTVSWVQSGTAGGSASVSLIDFNTSHSVPAFTAITTDVISNVHCDTGTTTLDGNEKGFAVSVPDSDFPTNTSMTVTIGDGTNTLSAATINTISKGVVVGNPGTLSSGTLEITFTLSSTDSSTPTLSSYGVKVLR